MATKDEVPDEGEHIASSAHSLNSIHTIAPSSSQSLTSSRFDSSHPTHSGPTQHCDNSKLRENSSLLRHKLNPNWYHGSTFPHRIHYMIHNHRPGLIASTLSTRSNIVQVSFRNISQHHAIDSIHIVFQVSSHPRYRLNPTSSRPYRIHASDSFHIVQVSSTLSTRSDIVRISSHPRYRLDPHRPGLVHAIDSIHIVQGSSHPRYRLDPHRPGFITSTLSIDSIHIFQVLSHPRYRLDPHLPGLIVSTLSTRSTSSRYRV